MKKLLLSIALVGLGVSANAQLLDETFDSTIPGTWTIIDNDGYPSSTGQATWIAWAWYDDGDACSSSWYDNSGTGPTDDWLISPQVVIPGAGTYMLQFDARSHETGTYFEEYEVLISTTGTSMANFTNNELSVVDETNAWNTHSIDLSAYAGQSIYIAFHHTSDDESMLHIDNVLVDQVYPDDAAITALSVNPVVVAGMVSITGTVKNEGTNTITSFDIDWNDGTPHNQTFTQTIAPGATYNFTHGTQLNAMVGNTYNIDVCVSLTGDGDPADDCMSTQVAVVSSVPTKNTLGEEKTGTWCQWCPRGGVALAGMESTSTFIGVAVHNGDPMTIPAYDGNLGTYVPGGYPGGGVDRVEVGDPADFQIMHNARINEIAPANVSVSAVQVGANMEVTVTANWVMTANGVNYRLGAIITEDDVIGTGASWNQVNAYNGGGSGPLTDPVSGFDWTTAGSPVNPNDFGGYDHVARALGGNQILGDAGSVPANITDGGSDSYTYTIPVGSWELGKCHFIGFLCDAGSGEILNAASTSNYTGNSGIEEAEVNGTLSIYPNPTSDLTTIKLELVEAADVTIQIINALGQVVFTSSTAQLPAGEHFYPIDVTDFAAGIYTVQSTVNGVVQSSKLSVK